MIAGNYFGFEQTIFKILINSINNFVDNFKIHYKLSNWFRILVLDK